MDFRGLNNQRGQQGQTAASPQVTQTPMKSTNHDNHSGKGSDLADVPGWTRIANVVLLFSITVLAIALVFLFRNANPSEQNYINTAKWQAVFLNNGQVYFGKITAINSKFIDLQDIFYLNNQTQNGSSTNSSQTQSGNFTLVKLGCELHGPYDQMVINSGQYTFWENLKDNGQVVNTINEWIKENPNGQTCTSNTGSTNQSQSSSTSSSSNATSTTKK